MKRTILILMGLFLMTPSMSTHSQAASINDLISDPIPEMLTVVSAKYDESLDWIKVNWKIGNVPDNSDPVDVYLFLKSKNDLTTYFIKIDLVALLMGSDLMSTITVVDYQSKFLDAFDIASYHSDGELTVDSFPVDVSIIPSLSEGKYLIYLAVVDPSTDEVISSTIDILKYEKTDGPQGCDPNDPTCDPSDPYNDPNYDPNGGDPNYDPNTDPNQDPNQPMI